MPQEKKAVEIKDEDLSVAEALVKFYETKKKLLKAEKIGSRNAVELETTISNLGDKITKDLAAGSLDSTLSQQQLIQWVQYNLNQFDTFSDKDKNAFLRMFDNKEVIERLLLNKGFKNSKGEIIEDKEAIECAKIGNQFLKNLLRTGASEYNTQKLDPNFPVVNHNLGYMRLKIDDYLKNDLNFRNAEKEQVEMLRETAANETKAKWQALTTKFNSLIHDDPEIKLNISNLIYKDLLKKASVGNDKNLEKYQKFSKENLNYKDFFNQKDKYKSDPDFTSLVSEIEQLEKNYYTLDENKINLNDAERQTLSPEIKTLVSNTKSHPSQVNLMSTLSFILKNNKPLPDYVTREDLINLFIFDSNSLKVLQFQKNEPLIDRLGDINEFIELVQLRKQKLSIIGMELEDSILRNFDIIDDLHELASTTREQRAEQRHIKQLIEYHITVEESSALIMTMQNLIEIGEQKVQYQSQIKDINKLSKNLSKLNINEDQKQEFISYLNETSQNADQHRRIPTKTVIETLDSLKISLNEKFNTLKQIEEHINTSRDPDDSLHPDVEHVYIDIQRQLIEIENTRKKIDLLKLHASFARDEKDIDNSKEVNPSHLPSISTNRENKDRVLYAIIMTRKSILEGKPNREYLNEIYKNPKIASYLLSSPFLRSDIKALNEQLVIETAHQMKIAARESLAQTDKRFFSIDPTTNQPFMTPSPDNIPVYQKYINSRTDEIVNQINSCTSIESRRKINKFWVRVMVEAHNENDHLTLNMVKNALDSQDISGFRPNQEVYSWRTKRLISTVEHVIGEKGQPIKDYTTGLKGVMESGNYDIVPDPAVFMAQAAILQAEPNKESDEAKYALKALGQFTTVHEQIQSNFVITPANSPIFNVENPGVEQVAPEIKAEVKSVKPAAYNYKDDLQKLDAAKNDILQSIIPSQQEQNDSLNRSVKANLANYLSLVKSGWDTQRINSSSVNIEKYEQRDRYISDAIRALNFSNSTKETSSILNELHQNLEHTIEKSSNSKMVNFYRTRVSKTSENSEDLSLIKDDMNNIKNINILVKHLSIKHQAETKEVLSNAEQKEQQADASISTPRASVSINSFDDLVEEKKPNSLRSADLLNDLIPERNEGASEHDDLFGDNNDDDLENKRSASIREPKAKQPLASLFDDDLDDEMDISPRSSVSSSSSSEDDDLSSRASNSSRRSSVSSSVSEEEYDNNLELSDDESDLDDASIYDSDLDEPDDLSQEMKGWQNVELTNLPMQQNNAGIQLPVSRDFKAGSTMPREYRHRGTGTNICESYQDNLYKVDVVVEPFDYDRMTLNDKIDVDLIIADGILDLLVKRFDNLQNHTIEILDTNNVDRMSALIFMCEARGLKYSIENNNNHSLSRGSEPLDSKINTIEREMNDVMRAKVDGLKEVAAERPSVEHSSRHP